MKLKSFRFVVVLLSSVASVSLAGPAQLAKQKALAEATANGRNDENYGNPRAQQKNHTKACGQALNVTFDWKTFPDEDILPKSPPRWDYTLSKDGKTVDKYTCKDAGNSGSFKEIDWIKDVF